MPLPVGPLSMKPPNISGVGCNKRRKTFKLFRSIASSGCFYRCHFGLHDIAGVHGRASRICCHHLVGHLYASAGWLLSTDWSDLETTRGDALAKDTVNCWPGRVIETCPRRSSHRVLWVAN
jgi:hypothetical protein